MDERARRRLERDQIAWLTTVDANGQPQASPVWFVWEGEALHVASEPGAAKLANIAVNPCVAVHLDGAGPGELIVTVEGVASRTEGVPSRYSAKYAASVARLGLSVAEYLDRFSAGMRVEPTRWRIFESD
jgi:PPOX class probable F420-dependent enzyme